MPVAQVRIATIDRGRFVSDVTAQGVVIAALSPTLVVRAGERVLDGRLLATVDSPELRNKFAKEKASLENQEATCRASRSGSAASRSPTARPPLSPT